MRVVFITREGYRLAGARVRCYNFARELEKHGVSSEVISFADDFGAACGEEEVRMPLRRRFLYNAGAFRRLLKKEKDSVFFVQRFHYHALAPLLVSLIKRQKVIFDCDDWNIREDPVYHFGFYPSSKMEFLTRCFARYAASCIAASHFLLDFLKSFNKKVFYVPTGVDTDFFKPRVTAVRPRTFVFGWIGTAYHKEMGENLLFLYECFSALAKKYPHVYLKLAGEGVFFEKFKSEVKKREFSDRVLFCGWIPPHHMPDFIETMDVGILPLIQDTKFNKAKSPTKLFEYMAMAKAAVVSRVGEAPDIITDGENGFLASTKMEFIEKMERLAVDVSIGQTVGERARLCAQQKFSLSVLGGFLADIVSRIS